MELEDATTCVPDPSNEFGCSEIQGKVWVCPECDHEEEYDPADDEIDMDDDS